MSDDAEVLQRIRQALGECARPDHFTNYMHCQECAEHDEVLRSRDVDSLRTEDVGNPDGDPFCFVLPEGFAYYLPVLARFTLEQPSKPYFWYGSALLFHLSYEGRHNEHLAACTDEQRQSVLSLLYRIFETRADLADEYGCGKDLVDAIEYWSGSGLTA